MLDDESGPRQRHVLNDMPIITVDFTLKELEHLKQSLSSLREEATKIKTTEITLSTEDSTYQTHLVQCRKGLHQLKAVPKDLLQEEHMALLTECEASLRHIERIRPITPLPWLLCISLGSSAQLRLPDTRQRLKYKSEYESFKLQATLLHLTMSILQLATSVFTASSPCPTLLDTLTSFLLLYFYSSLTLREHILVVNGSNIRAWWIIHHYLCVALTGTLLIWPTSEAYYASRNKLVIFSIYMAAVQAMQYRYQMSRLYVLRSLARVGPMDITTESAQVHVRNNLAFLLPFLIIGYAFQFYLAYWFWCLSAKTILSKEWHIPVIAVLFSLIVLGNVTTTLYTFYLKSRYDKNSQHHGMGVMVNSSLNTSSTELNKKIE